MSLSQWVSAYKSENLRISAFTQGPRKKRNFVNHFVYIFAAGSLDMTEPSRVIYVHSGRLYIAL
jgi:hypothetical protein